MLHNLQNLIKICVCFGGLLYVFFTVIDFTYFTSFSKSINLHSGPRGTTWANISQSLLVNMSLLSMFIIQHSLLALTGISSKIKYMLNKLGLEVLYRSIYVITTAAVLQLLMNRWVHIHEVTLWQLNLNYQPFWWLYVSLHVTAWVIIYVGNICTDITELLGIKQVRYSLYRVPRDPCVMKSENLRRLYNHMRHPSFVAFTLIFWATPIMTLDRFLLACILTLYMTVTWKTDEKDYNYQKYQYIRKYHELDRLKR
ncbi:nurim homolog [Aethina tumida]|uniref:nurim homolog n=1 Tax=Aethina tumida TaxID=116153 RepID=UPI00096B28D0|nr:nurim homolog [Aethina tumida]